jgi:hypothetical protein
MNAPMSSSATFSSTLLPSSPPFLTSTWSPKKNYLLFLLPASSFPFRPSLT